MLAGLCRDSDTSGGLGPSDRLACVHQTFHFDRHSAECERPSSDHPAVPKAALPSPLLEEESPSSPTTAAFAAAACAAPRFAAPPPAASCAELCARPGPPRRHSEPLPRFPGPTDVPADPADFPAIE